MNQSVPRLDAVHEGQRRRSRCRRATSAAQASGPWIARKTRSSGVDRARRNPLASVLQMRFVGGGIAGIGDDHEALVGRAG